jgi:polar amino acid transport system permease protein
MKSNSSRGAERVRSAPREEILEMKIAPNRHWGRKTATVLVALIVVGIIYSLATNPRWGWDLIGRYLFSERILFGVFNTVLLTLISMAFSLVLGVFVAVARLSSNRLIAGLAAVYVWFFRGVPLLVLLLFIFFGAALVPTIDIGIPTLEPWISIDTNSLLTQFTAAVLAISLTGSAYMGEVLRGGIQGVHAGQLEAAKALGMTYARAMRRIILPQTLRVVIPPISNEFIGMMKGTSLVSVIGFAELLTTVQHIYSLNFRQIPLLTVAAIWYLILVSIAQLGEYFLERRLAAAYVDRSADSRSRTSKVQVS